jgi:hypothetical protein
MLVVTSFVGIPMCHIFPCNTLVTWDLGRILVIFTSCLECKYGVNHVYRVCESRGSYKEDV